MADVWVQNTQNWLNSTYGLVDGWVWIEENGLTGWDTIYGLRRGLQHELGISPVSSGFGPATTAAFTAQIGTINDSTTWQNVLKLASGALWCKGEDGDYNGFGAATTFSAVSSGVTKARSDLGLAGAATIDVKLMASLLSMDAYTIPPGSGGTTEIREVQQWLNGTYVNRRDFAIVPCDGLFSRQIQTALLYALQYEFGMADGTANGNFGPGTRSGLASQAPVSQGSADSAHRFVHLYQAALRFNGYHPPFDGTFGATTATPTSTFQAFMELAVTGAGDYGTWCALLVSSGDPNRTVSGFDTSVQLTPTQAQAARSAGYTHVGRYTVGAGKFITAQELAGLKSAGLRLFPIEQRFNNSDAEMTEANGRAQGIEALERCRCLGLPDGSTIFFAVDYDPTGDSISGPVTNYFTGVNAIMAFQLAGRYTIGVYGTRNVCQTIIDAGLASAAFVAGMSTGWSGNMGFTMPDAWHYNQILETSETLGGTTTALDHVAVSSHAAAIDLAGVTPPPIEHDGSESATGFNHFFEWMVSAEATCERALSGSLGEGLVTSLPDYILGWLRKPTYWDARPKAFFWQAYTPQYDSTDAQRLARAACESALSGLSDIRTEVDGGYLDLAHMATTTLGYLERGLGSNPAGFTWGDFGGWPLDLIQLWGSYLNYVAGGGTANLGQWLSAHLAVVNDNQGFSYSDLVADADGWLLAKSVGSGARALSQALRYINQVDSNERLIRFYNERFAGSPDNVVAAFTDLSEGLLTGQQPWDASEFPLELVSGASREPNAQEAEPEFTHWG
ncbi:glycoside hydrolase domain-containing protein [Raineyella sp. W15-4]|uniref:glycoside hydrolase domain-containing protein n=1 Tax=Raineyella sp. W15-4 TaxID=3081651 RepID=UPI0029532EB8|nr:glycoside hydrolase domain-containing protein [Raineyella sp. W15-4]WOQ15463.1 DUF1906 domain-containing protein [Raineyella sp. W15-4]